MAVQAPVFFDHLGFPVTGSSQDNHCTGVAPNSGFGFPNLVVGLLNTVTPSPATATSSSSLSGPLNLHPSNALADELDLQTREIDAFLQLQGERLRYAIQQQNREQITALLNSVEQKAVARLRRTEQDLARVTRRARELEECLKGAEMETEAWKKTATENEAMVVGLNNMLGQARERLSWASGGLGPAQDAESTAEDRVGTRRMECEGCKTRRSCVVFLPCKHLCACRQCGGLLGVCPVCESVKEGTIEVFFE